MSSPTTVAPIVTTADTTQQTSHSATPASTTENRVTTTESDITTPTTTTHSPPPATTTTSTTTTTTTTTTTSTTTLAPPAVIVVTAVLVVPFTPQLSDRNSIGFKTLEVQVVTIWNVILRSRYGASFLGSYVIQFREAVTTTKSANTEADVGVNFSNRVDQVPPAVDVANLLVMSLSNPNNTYNLTVVPSSVQALYLNATSNATTVSPTLNSATGVTSTATTVPPTLNSTTSIQVYTATSGTSGTMSPTASAEALTTKNLVFRSKETFTSDLNNPSSVAYRNRASLITTTLTPFYNKAFDSFKSIQVTDFSNGSIYNRLLLRFASASVPNDTAIGEVLIKAASNITSFNIDITYIFVDNTQVSSGISQRVSIITASCLVLLSWLLSNQQ
ncbi:integumentary mucin C.1-like [Betta splendens]|uniref:Integumentary mucin C.1-like n=1 Tax=Betta splendens TaxID=158456 RepID=A0A6P7LYN9_BETSP|nr:integumentary mucin C.1-like [Betta splendens]